MKTSEKQLENLIRDAYFSGINEGYKLERTNTIKENEAWEKYRQVIKEINQNNFDEFKAKFKKSMFFVLIWICSGISFYLNANGYELYGFIVVMLMFLAFMYI